YYVEHGAAEGDIDRKLYAKIAYFEGESKLAGDYLFDLQYALDFAVESRREMLLRILEIFSELFPNMHAAGGVDLIGESFDLTHNFVAQEDHWGERFYIHRKGATRAVNGLMGIVPGSMGSSSYVIEGRGNEYSFCSCAHGAGRAMSRAEAFRAISEKDFKRSMQQIVYEHDDRLKDESPLAYKDIQRVMRGQRDLVKILYELQPLMSIKGVNSSAQEDREDDS
ncbi:MAG: RtcB family protein, partial [Candidatus Omnitrophica bacterium]|nr:RtcB family protein [Candidatus Omnitrophota bacterium]